jgi:hypothetical protein
LHTRQERTFNIFVGEKIEIDGYAVTNLERRNFPAKLNGEILVAPGSMNRSLKRSVRRTLTCCQVRCVQNRMELLFRRFGTIWMNFTLWWSAS